MRTYETILSDEELRKGTDILVQRLGVGKSEDTSSVGTLSNYKLKRSMSREHIDVQKFDIFNTKGICSTVDKRSVESRGNLEDYLKKVLRTKNFHLHHVWVLKPNDFFFLSCSI